MRSISSLNRRRKRSRSAGASAAIWNVSAIARAPASGVRNSCARFATRSERARRALLRAVTSSTAISCVARPPAIGRSIGAAESRASTPLVRWASREP